ncbi:dual specificity calcium/calmodulin-dependent 3',5'-cyclic nucleotide phosphodiesterase 1A-like isoform X3 [Branchiostoma lanceolatum]|uniref:dual specificity calcium/calmodulin-dependent 3',5'-cyclic nucleotide phosphodiesterase 1A-like isoform X3 n=1 Tax=Branchiostoma lanceolatum TaxID=7740 RepID=UPI0034541BC1
MFSSFYEFLLFLYDVAIVCIMVLCVIYINYVIITRWIPIMIGFAWGLVQTYLPPHISRKGDIILTQIETDYYAFIDWFEGLRYSFREWWYREPVVDPVDEDSGEERRRSSVDLSLITAMLTTSQTATDKENGGQTIEKVANAGEKNAVENDTQGSSMQTPKASSSNESVSGKRLTPRKKGSPPRRQGPSKEDLTMSLELSTDNLPPTDSLEALEKASKRIRKICTFLQSRGNVPSNLLKRNLHYIADVLEIVATDDARRFIDEDDELSEVEPDAVPMEVRDWLASTFTRSASVTKSGEKEKKTFRSIVQAVRAANLVDRLYRRMSTSAVTYPPTVMKLFKQLDDWSFDVFALNEATNGQALRYVTYEIMMRYDLLAKFKIGVGTLFNFLEALEVGYSKYQNPYHNLVHGADVTQTMHSILFQTGLVQWLTDVEIFAVVFSAAIHDFEHTGETNNFHVMSRTETALVYNDRAVQENHHISAAFRLMTDDNLNIVYNMSKEDYKDFRTLVIDMVLATDMSYHFAQVKQMKSLLSCPDNIDKAKALSLVLHTADISHPAKDWTLHEHWTELLMEEFFRQGDKEQELGLPFSPLCDRKTTMVASSQIGFIDFIVQPSFEIMSDMLDKVVAPISPRGSLANQSSATISEKVEGEGSPQNGDQPEEPFEFKVDRVWDRHLTGNKVKWKEQSTKDQAEKEAKEKAAQKEKDDSEQQKQSTLDDKAEEKKDPENPPKITANGTVSPGDAVDQKVKPSTSPENKEQASTTEEAAGKASPEHAEKTSTEEEKTGNIESITVKSVTKRKESGV